MRKLLLFYCATTFFVLISTYFYSLDAVLKYIHYGFGAILVMFMSVGGLLALSTVTGRLLGQGCSLGPAPGHYRRPVEHRGRAPRALWRRIDLQCGVRDLAGNDMQQGTWCRTSKILVLAVAQ